MSIKLDLKAPQSGRFSFAEQIGVVVILLLLGAAWLVPLLIQPWVSWHHEVWVFVAVFALTAHALFLRVRSADRWVALRVSEGLLVGLALLIAVQAMSGVLTFGGDAFVLVLYLALALMAWSWGAAQVWTEQRLHGSLYVAAALILTAALLSALLALVQVFDVWEHAAWVNRMPQLRRPGANLGQPNHLGTLLLMGLGSLLYLYEKHRLSTSTAILIFGVLSVALAATESRTGLLNVLLLCAWWALGWRRFGFRLQPGAALFGAGACVGMFWAWPRLMAGINFFEPGASVNTGDSLRLVVWSQLLEAAWLHPWLGWGLREVSEAHNAVVHTYATSVPFTYAHNIVLDLLIGIGIPLTALLMIVSSVWLWRRIRAVRDLHTWYCLAMVLPVAVHSMLEFPFAYAYFLAPAMFFLGVLDGTTGGKVVARINIKWLGAGWLVFAALGAWSVVEYLKIEEDFRIVRFESMRLGQTPQDYERPNIVLLTQLGALLEGGRIVPAPDMPAERIELARKVALRFPWPATQHRYALSLALNGQIDEAERQLQVIRALHGGKTYTEIKANWQTLAASKYPQLAQIRWP